MATDAELAWAAGLFEGEGSFHIAKTPYGSRVPVMNLGMTDRDVVEKFQRIADSSRVKGPIHRVPGRKPMYTLEIAKRSDVKRLILAFLPWFGERRTAKAREVLALIEELDAAAAYREKFCKRGHPWTPENIYTSPRGIRACRQCKKDHGREWMRQKRAGEKLANSAKVTGSGS